MSERAPYQRGIMDAFSESGVEEVVMMSSAQVGKTLILKSLIGYFIDLDPSPILVVQPTIEMGETFSKDRLAPMIRDFYVFIPSWMWHGRPTMVLNTANYFTWEVLNNHSGLAISPTLIGSLVVMGGVWFVPLGAVAVGLIIKWFDWLYELGNRESNRYKAAILHSFCFGAIFNMIVLAREGLDSFGSRVVFFLVIFGICLLAAKLLYWFLDSVGLIHKRVKPLSQPQV